MTPVMPKPLSPCTIYPRLRGSGLGAGGGRQAVGGVDAGEVNVGEDAHEVDEALEAEDVQPQQHYKSPELPSRQAVEEHRIDHWPPRTWCDECNEGFGRERAHGLTESHGAAIVSMDYMFVTKKGSVVLKDEPGWDDPEALKILVVKDSRSKSVFAHAVPQKGIDDKRFAVDQIVNDILWLGYSQVILKSDNEPAIVKLLKESLASLKVSGLDQVGEEHSPPYDSQANGAVEAAVKQVRTRLRTMKLCLERRIGRRIPPRHPVMAWLASHVSAVIRFRVRGPDGKTPYERVRMRPFNTKLICFGERCRYKDRSKEPEHDEHKWHQGLFLGICPQTGQYVLHDVDTKLIRKARTINTLPDAVKWNSENVESIRITPYDAHANHDPEVVFGDRPAKEGDKDVARKVTARRPYIMERDIRALGGTVGCPRCDSDRRYGPGRTTKGHSEACRERITNELMKTPEGQRRIAAAENRMNRSIAEHIEEHADPHGHGGGDAVGHAHDDDLKFEPLNESDRRVDEPQKVDEPGSPSPVHGGDYASREVPPPADEAGGAETHADPGMDIDTIEEDIPMDELLALWDRGTRDEAKVINSEILSLVNSLGGSSSKYRRERGKAFRAIVSEIYSPPRVSAVAKLCPSFGILPGFALDLTTHDSDGRHWDFDEEDMRARAWAKVKSEEPLLLIGSPMCTAFSAWQHINNAKRDPAVVAKEYERGLRHLSFCCELYEYQARHGRYFLHEHPAQAMSWCTDVVKKIMNLEGVERTVGHQCQYGAQSDGQPIKKPTGFMSNCPGIRKALSKICSGRHGQCSRAEGGDHILCNGRVARMAAIFPLKLCKAILSGLRSQLKSDGIVIDGEVGLHAIDPMELDNEHVEVDGHLFKFDDGQGPFFDDLTKQELPKLLVQAARRKELEYFESKSVWKRVPISEAHRIAGRAPITVRWVDVNKGDDEVPDIRSRLVARQIRGANEDPMFAPTPPLEALRTVLSYAATDMEGEKPKCRDGRSPNRVQLSLIDISRAYFNAHCDPANPTFVNFPTEDSGHRDTCGLLLKHMYGTQAAADGWQQEYSSTMIKLGFIQGVASPCVFWHKERELVCSVHGDDFTTAGAKPNLDWFESSLEAKYELRKGGRIGPGDNDDKEGRVLNRIIRWTKSGLEYEADPRQVERLIESLGLDGNCKSTATPGLKPTKEQTDAEQALDVSEHTPFRGNAARCNYVGPDRPDVQYCAKEICRWMSSPTDLSVTALRRLVRFLLGRKRLVFRYPWQRAGTLECYSDTDWAGCPKTRKSTSGGCLMLGGHLLKSWSSTQPSISLSSGEAEYYGVVKATGIALGQQSLMSDLGMKVKVRVWTDSSAAIGICGRSGLGKLRHVQTHTLWVQERVRTGAIELRKVHGLVNPADLFTKHLSSRERMSELVKLFNCEYREGRATSAPELRKNVNQPDINSIDVADNNGGHGGHADGGRGGQTGGLDGGRTDEWRNKDKDKDEDDDLSEAHDPAVLPHEYNDEDLEKLFKKAEVPAEVDASSLNCICSRPECKRCFPPRAREFMPPVSGAEAWAVFTQLPRTRVRAGI